MVRTESAIRRHHGGASILDVTDAKLPKTGLHIVEFTGAARAIAGLP